jgi:hypothetical protein
MGFLYERSTDKKMSGSPDMPKKLYKQVDIKLIFKQLSYEL